MRLRASSWTARLAVIAAAIACALALASAEGSSCDGCASNLRSAPRLQTSIEQQLAEKYAPVVYIKDQTGACDRRGSPYEPVPVEFVFDVDSIVLKQHEGGRTSDVASGFDAAELYGKGREYFMDFPGNPKRPGCGYEQDYLARAGDFGPVTYAHIAREDGRSGFALQYWLFYYFNDWNNKHEGDWEMIQLTFEDMTPEEALTREPTGVGYSQHGSGERGGWHDSKVTKEGDHPVAFVAAGANANQFEANIILGRGDNGTGFGCDDATRPSRRVAPEVRLTQEPTSANSEFAWLAYDGLWGERAPWEFSGPTGPNDKRAWSEPFSWQESLRPGSIIVPSSNTIGPNAVNFFCDAVWIASQPLFIVFHLPPVVFLLGAVVGVCGVAVLSTRTRYRPIDVAPLRRRRRFGQALTSGARIYRRGAVMFLVIGLAFVPAGLAIAGLQWALFFTPYIDTVAGFFSDSVAAKALIALVVGNVTASLVHWFVATSTVAALARTEAGERDSALASFGLVLRRMPVLILPTLRALVVVVLLSLSIVGIPWAIWQANRWTFINETILLDGTRRQDALAASARAVKGHWWHTFLCLQTLLFVGYLLGPTVALTLLLTTSMNVALINLVSSLIFATVTPYFSIVKALLYFNLTSAEAGAPAPEASPGPEPRIEEMPGT